MGVIISILVLLALIVAGAALLYKIGEVIVETQDATCHGEYRRWRREHGTEEDNDGDSH
ncbi:hypothetical protein [Gallintestinimicrobium sp.]|uniref:hypothetical protein n=1 Tax=Gallintestinimicrobium sp. TaxID=2981655 RepID=UPI00399AAAF1